MAIWKWAKANGIDRGESFEKIHDAINQRFFGGAAKPEWISDILSGRKTPLRLVSDAAWKAANNRRQVVRQAQDLSRTAALGPIAKAFRTVTAIPREIATAGHGFVFPISHAGDLAFRPASWGAFFKGLMRTYGTAFGRYAPARAERIMQDMERRPLFRTAERSGLDVGAKSEATGLLPGWLGRNMSKRAWDMLTTMRYELWENQMKKFTNSGMSNEEVLDMGKNLATWANHATGSAKMPLKPEHAHIAGELLFGPKLTTSKLARIAADPAKTIATFANWSKATPGEQAAAKIRLSGAVQYAATRLGFLAANQGVLMALGSKQKVNLTNPTKSDWSD